MSSEHSSGRLLAPLALIAVTLVIAVLVAGSMGGSDSAPVVSDPVETTSGSSSTSTQGSQTGSRRGENLPQRNYVVKPGDNFEAISTKTGIPTDKLLELNPDLDPQALISGQKVRLR